MNGYSAVAEDFIAMKNEEACFKSFLGMKLVYRSRELPTAATPEILMTEVLEDCISEGFDKLLSFRRKRYMQRREISAICEALRPMCREAYVVVNEMLADDRNYLLPPNAYVRIMGSVFYEDAPSVTFVRFLNVAERLKQVNSRKYERYMPYVAEIHALNRVAQIMPREFHQGRSGTLQPGQSYDAAWTAQRQAWRDRVGIHTSVDLLARAGAA